MKQTQFSVLFLITAVLSSVHSASGQAINATLQTASPRRTTTRSASALAAKPIAGAPVAPHIVGRPPGFSPRALNPYAPGTISSSVPNTARNYSPYIVRSLNATVSPVSIDRSARIGDQRAIMLDPAIQQTELRTLAAMREHRALGIAQPVRLDPATRETELRTLSAMQERHGFATENRILAAIDPQQHATEDPATAPQSELHEPLKDTQAKKSHHKNDNMSFDQASRRHWHEWHDRNWWHSHCDTIVFVTTGCYFLDGSYWYPAWGYDPLQSYYDYDGPIYSYGDLLPDEVIANVQTALQDTGYYYGQISGSLGVDTRAALANFQRDYGLPITGAIDEPTVEALGLY